MGAPTGSNGQDTGYTSSWNATMILATSVPLFYFLLIDCCRKCCCSGHHGDMVGWPQYMFQFLFMSFSRLRRLKFPQPVLQFKF